MEFKQPQSVQASLKRIGILTLVVGAAFVGAQLLGALVALSLSFANIPLQGSIGYSLAVIAQGTGFIGVSLWYLYSEDMLDIVPIRVPDTDDYAWMLGGFFLIILLAVGVGALVQTLGLETAQNQVTEQGNQNPEVYLLLIPLAFLAVGTSEELLFRGLVQKRLEPFFGTGGAVLVGCLIFAVAHVFALQGGLGATITTIGVLFVVSLVFGVSYVATDNLLVPIVIHGAYDAAIFALLYVSTTTDIGSSTLLLLLPF